VVFIDTAGLRDSGDEIEAEGIRRSRESLGRAEMILHVLDASEVLTPADERHWAELDGKKRLLICNKADLPRRCELPGGMAASAVEMICTTGQGLETLKDRIKECVWSGDIKAEMLQVMINSRHQEALKRAREATLGTIEALRGGLTLELVALDLRIAVNAVGEIVGKTSTEDLLDSVFSQFCIGK